MSTRVNFLNPFGTRNYDTLIDETLSHYKAPSTELTISHLDNCPPDIDFYYNKHLIEAAVFEAVMRSEEEGYDAVIVGCCYDPGVRAAREIVNIPVVGPMEATIQMAPYFGHSSVIVTDFWKAAPYLRDLALLYGAERQVTDVRAIEWYVKDMINDRGSVAQDVIRATADVAESSRAEVILLGCTIVAACYQEHLINGGEPAVIPVLNPNLMALKVAEGLGQLNKMGGYQISRRGYYEDPKGHHLTEFKTAREKYNKVISGW